AQELGIRRKRLYVWKDRYAELGEAGLRHRRAGRPRKVVPEGKNGPDAMSGRGELLAARKRVAELERKVGQQELEFDEKRLWLSGCPRATVLRRSSHSMMGVALP